MPVIGQHCVGRWSVSGAIRCSVFDAIVEIDGQAVANEDDYANIMEQHRAGDVVRVKTQRDNGLVEYDIELQARPDR